MLKTKSENFTVFSGIHFFSTELVGTELVGTELVGTEVVGTELVGTELTRHRTCRHRKGGTEKTAPKRQHRKDGDPF